MPCQTPDQFFSPQDQVAGEEIRFPATRPCGRGPESVPPRWVTAQGSILIVVGFRSMARTGVLPGGAHPAGVGEVCGGADRARQAQHTPRPVGAFQPGAGEVGATQRFRVAKGPGLAEVTGFHRVAVLIAWVQRPPQLVHVATVKIPRANAVASDSEIVTPGTPRP